MMKIDVHEDRMILPGHRPIPCVIGKKGMTSHKREGDEATPIGCWPLRQIFYRPDRVPAPKSILPAVPLGPHDGWCDASGDPMYNRQIALPYPASHERLWREDNIYDIIVTLGYNDDPPKPGAGSAIFIHIAREDGNGTRGCVALCLPDLQYVLENISVFPFLDIKPGQKKPKNHIPGIFLINITVCGK